MRQWISESIRNTMVVAQIGLLLAVPVALLTMHVWNQYRLAEVGYEIAEATDEHQELLEENKKLKVEARLQGRSDRVAEIAQQEYGLGQPGPDQFVAIDAEPDDPDADGGEHARLRTVDQGDEPSLPQ